MEKVKYGGTTFDLVPGGLGVPDADGRLTIRHQLGDKSLAEIKAIAKAVTAADSIDLLDADGKLMQSLDGYIYAGSIQEIDDYLVKVQHLDQEPMQTEEVRADIAVVTFMLPDVREELKTVKAVQDELLVAVLEGGI